MARTAGEAIAQEATRVGVSDTIADAAGTMTQGDLVEAISAAP